MDIRNQRFLEIERRSALGLIWVYNRIPEAIIDATDIKDFHGQLQMVLKQRTAAIYHACDYVLAPLNAIQDKVN